MNSDNRQNAPNINWFPGHMEKARRQMEANLKLVDIVIELRDSRVPLSSANPMLKTLIANKPHLLILTKKDMADPKVLKDWLEWFKRNGIFALAVDASHDNLKKLIVEKVKEILKDKIERAKAKGIRKKVMRAMVCGIPNVGKSTLINNIVKKRVAKVENRPGVTKSLSWIRLNEDLELLDTPGVLWPKFQDQDAARKLVLIGSIKDEVIDKEDIINFALDYFRASYPEIFKERYRLTTFSDDNAKVLEDVARSLQFVGSGGELDILRVQNFILADIRNDRLKGVSFEVPCE